MAFTISEGYTKRLDKEASFEDALDLSGFGKYNIGLLVACMFLVLGMYLDVFGVSVAMPAMACDMSLNTNQQGLLSAIPLIGVMLSSYAWGLCADTKGRRTTLLIAMPIGFILNLASTMAPNYASLAVIKLLSVSFTSSANAAAFVLLAESVPSRHRSRFMFLMASATMVVQFVICAFAVPIFKLDFNVHIPWLNIKYTPWRLLLQAICMPCGLGVLCIVFFKESPKFLLSKNRNEEALEVFKSIFMCNTGSKKEAYYITHVYIDEDTIPSTETSVLKKVWNQTAPLFKRPLLKNSAMIYYLILCAYMTATGFSMWVPTLTNAYFTGDESNYGRTFCDVASQSTRTTSNGTVSVDCTRAIQPMALYVTMCYSGVSTSLTIFLSFIVTPVGKKTVTILIFTISSFCGVVTMFVKIPVLSILLFFMFLYVAQILGNMNTYLVELNPTHLRGMATCLSVVAARGSGFFGVQIIASLIGDYCMPMLSGFILLVMSGLVVALFLPSDSKSKADIKIELNEEMRNIERNENVVECTKM